MYALISKRIKASLREARYTSLCRFTRRLRMCRMKKNSRDTRSDTSERACRDARWIIKDFSTVQISLHAPMRRVMRHA